jgi:hypothetical protein
MAQFPAVQEAPVAQQQAVVPVEQIEELEQGEPSEQAEQVEPVEFAGEEAEPVVAVRDDHGAGGAEADDVRVIVDDRVHDRGSQHDQASEHGQGPEYAQGSEHGQGAHDLERVSGHGPGQVAGHVTGHENGHGSGFGETAEDTDVNLARARRAPGEQRTLRGD